MNFQFENKPSQFQLNRASHSNDLIPVFLTEGFQRRYKDVLRCHYLKL